MVGVVLYAGFHKTGTTTAQHTLRNNAALLAPHLRTYLKADMKALCEAARAASQKLDEVNLGLLRYEAAALAQEWTEEHRTVLLASEDLSGHMPGRRGLVSYARTPDVLHAIVEGFTAVVAQIDLTFVFTTRRADPWLRSCYAQHVRATRMTLDEADYVQKYAPSADLGGIVGRVAKRLPYPVHAAALEDCATPLDPVLSLVDLPAHIAAAITPSPQANKRPSQDKLDKLLALNRSDLSPEALRTAKKALMSKAAQA